MQVIATQNTDVNVHAEHCCPCTPWNTSCNFYNSASFSIFASKLNAKFNVISNLASLGGKNLRH